MLGVLWNELRGPRAVPVWNEITTRLTLVWQRRELFPARIISLSARSGISGWNSQEFQVQSQAMDFSLFKHFWNVSSSLQSIEQSSELGTKLEQVHKIGNLHKACDSE